MSTFLGLDIGYSNTIGTFGDGVGQSESFVRPSQAAPLASIPGDSGLRAGEVLVDVNGEPWVAFAAPGRVQEGRELTRITPVLRPIRPCLKHLCYMQQVVEM